MLSKYIYFIFVWVNKKVGYAQYLFMGHKINFDTLWKTKCIRCFMLLIKNNTKIGKEFIKTYRGRTNRCIKLFHTKTYAKNSRLEKSCLCWVGGSVTLSRTKVDSLYHQSYALAVWQLSVETCQYLVKYTKTPPSRGLEPLLVRPIIVIRHSAQPPNEVSV